MDGVKESGKGNKSSEICKKDEIHTLIEFLEKSFDLSNEYRLDSDVMGILNWDKSRNIGAAITWHIYYLIGSDPEFHEHLEKIQELLQENSQITL